MATFRVNKQKRFTTIDNTFANDERLSYKAVGIMTYLLTKPDNWRTMQKDLVKRHKDGPQSVSSGIAELLKFGYITKTQERDEQGHFKGWHYDVFEVPQPQPAETGKPPLGDTETGKPEIGKTETGETKTGKPEPTKDLSLVTTDSTNDLLKQTLGKLAPFSDIDFLERWGIFIQVRLDKSKGNPSKPGYPTENAIESIAKNCKKWGREKALNAINKSIENNWTGVFEPKEKKSKKQLHQRARLDASNSAWAHLE